MGQRQGHRLADLLGAAAEVGAERLGGEGRQGDGHGVVEPAGRIDRAAGQAPGRVREPVHQLGPGRTPGPGDVAELAVEVSARRQLEVHPAVLGVHAVHGDQRHPKPLLELDIGFRTGHVVAVAAHRVLEGGGQEGLAGLEVPEHGAAADPGGGGHVLDPHGEAAFGQLDTGAADDALANCGAWIIDRLGVEGRGSHRPHLCIC